MCAFCVSMVIISQNINNVKNFISVIVDFLNKNILKILIHMTTSILQVRQEGYT